MAQKKLTVAIVGRGLPGLLAAEAATRASCMVDITHDRRSQSHRPLGAFWMHDIPQHLKANVSRNKIVIRAHGTAQHYLEKQVVGLRDEEFVARYAPTTSFPPETYSVFGYSPPDLINYLQRKHFGRTHAVESVDGQYIRDLASHYDLVVVTTPTFWREQHSHIFDYTRGILIPLYIDWIPIDYGSTMNVLYNGEPLHPEIDSSRYCRISELWGIRSKEAGAAMNRDSEIVERGWNRIVIPDIPPDFDMPPECLDMPSNVVCAGRWATMDRKELSHQTYDAVTEAIRLRKAASGG